MFQFENALRGITAGAIAADLSSYWNKLLTTFELAKII